MCGIWGYVCKDEYDQRLDIAIPILSLYMESRGTHSWGFSDGVEIVKDTGSISNGLNPTLFGRKQAFFHTRHATTGSHSKENAHPWVFGEGENSLIGMHNGIINDEKELNKKHERSFEVDSMHIFQHIVEGKDLKELTGYGAIAYWKNGHLFLGRFNGGQLSIVKTPFGIVFASTTESISKAMKMAGINIETYYQVDDEKMYEVKEGQLYNTSLPFRFGSRYKPYTQTTPYYGNSRGHSNDEFEDWRRGHSYGNGYVSRGRWTGTKFEEGKEINGVFIPGNWNGKDFVPDSKGRQLLLESGQKKEKGGRKKERKVINIANADEKCALCLQPFEEDADTWETPMGEMCNGCTEICFRIEKTDEDKEDIIELGATIENTVGDGVGNLPDPYTVTSVRLLLQDTHTDDLTQDMDKDLEMLACNECSETLIADDTVYYDKDDNGKIKWLFCKNCHKDLTTPYNTNASLNFPVN